jgi:hypothetical protein
VSRLINYHPERVSGCAFFSGSYAPPVPPGANRISTGGDIKQKFGYDIFAYMRFFVQPDAPTVIEKNVFFLHFDFRRNHAYSHLFHSSTRSSVSSTPRKSSCGRTTCALMAAPARGSKAACCLLCLGT